MTKLALEMREQRDRVRRIAEWFDKNLMDKIGYTTANRDDITACMIFDTETKEVRVLLPLNADALTIVHELAHAYCVVQWPELFERASPERREAAALFVEMWVTLVQYECATWEEVKARWNAPFRNQEATPWAVRMAVVAFEGMWQHDWWKLEKTLYCILDGEFDV